MSDQPFYAPDRKPAPPRQRKPGEFLWTVQKDGQRLDCELRDERKAVYLSKGGALIE
jgi:hypothetical protein